MAKDYLSIEGIGRTGDKIQYQVELKYKEKELPMQYNK